MASERVATAAWRVRWRRACRSRVRAHNAVRSGPGTAALDRNNAATRETSRSALKRRAPHPTSLLGTAATQMPLGPTQRAVRAGWPGGAPRRTRTRAAPHSFARSVSHPSRVPRPARAGPLVPQHHAPAAHPVPACRGMSQRHHIKGDADTKRYTDVTSRPAPKGGRRGRCTAPRKIQSVLESYCSGYSGVLSAPAEALGHAWAAASASRSHLLIDPRSRRDLDA
jgi:hypothetical protein